MLYISFLSVLLLLVTRTYWYNFFLNQLPVALNSILFVNAIKHHVFWALLIGEWLLASELMISVLLWLPMDFLFPLDLLIFFSPSLMGGVCSDCIFLSFVLCQRTCTNCTSMGKVWSKFAVLGIDWTAGGKLNQYLNLESYDSSRYAVGQVIPVAGRTMGGSLVTHLSLLTGQHAWGWSTWKRVGDSFNDLLNHK